MMDLLLVNGRVMTDAGLRDDLAVAVSGDRIVATGPERALAESAGRPRRRIDLGGDLLLPGFIDTQVNGGGGVLFNDDPTPDTIRAIGAAHRRFGTTGFLPTLISDDLDVVEAGVTAASRAIAAGAPGVLGLHLEGPFLNPHRKGVHDASKMLQLEKSHLPLLTKLAGGRTLVTLAPEFTSVGTIAALTEAGVIVAAGHTDSTYDEMRAALAAGVRGFTHLFNAMSPLASRAPGVVGAALENQTAWCGIIVDGRHVSPAVLRIALRCRPTSRFMLVTDAMPCVGSDLTAFRLNGEVVTVADGVCRGASGALAGSDLDMASAVRNAVALLGLDLAEASRMASLYPAEFLGLDDQRGRIAAGFLADLVRLDDDLQVKDTWIAGLGQGDGEFA